MKLNPPIEITRPIPPQTTCPELRALRVKRDEWIISAVVQGFTAPQIAAALNMQSHQTVSAIISRWRCRHGKLATSDTASGNTRQPSDPAPLAGKHVVAFRDGHVTLPAVPWQEPSITPDALRPETAPRPAPIRHSTAKPHRIDANATIATIRALRDSYLEARHG